MYQVNTNKRYNAKVKYGNYSDHFFKVKLIIVERDFVVFEDSKGKEHIFTGSDTSIYISEV